MAGSFPCLKDERAHVKSSHWELHILFSSLFLQVTPIASEVTSNERQVQSVMLMVKYLHLFLLTWKKPTSHMNYCSLHQCWLGKPYSIKYSELVYCRLQSRLTNFKQNLIQVLYFRNAQNFRVKKTRYICCYKCIIYSIILLYDRVQCCWQNRCLLKKICITM